MTSPYCTPREASSYFHVDVDTVYAWMKAGKLPFQDYGRRCKRLLWDDIYRYERDHRVGRPAERRMEAVR